MESRKKRGSGAARLLAVMLLLGMCFTLGCGGVVGCTIAFDQAEHTVDE